MADEKDMTQKESEIKAVKYKVVNTCWWNDWLYHQDDVVGIASNLTPPKEHFTKI